MHNQPGSFSQRGVFVDARGAERASAGSGGQLGVFLTLGDDLQDPRLELRWAAAQAARGGRRVGPTPAISPAMRTRMITGLGPREGTCPCSYPVCASKHLTRTGSHFRSSAESFQPWRRPYLDGRTTRSRKRTARSLVALGRNNRNAYPGQSDRVHRSFRRAACATA